MTYLKKAIGYDDALDTFGVHGVGGTLGALLTGLLADESANPVVGTLKEGLFFNQLKAVILTIILSVVATVDHRIHREDGDRSASDSRIGIAGPGPQRSR